MRKIVGILLGQVETRLRSQQIELELTPEAVELLIEKGFDPSLGARPLKRAIQKHLEDPFSEFILRGQFAAGGRIRVARKDEQLAFETVSASVPPLPETSAPRA
jgi:ATP-dependent Clp protease ATP-binding subunit ClpC